MHVIKFFRDKTIVYSLVSTIITSAVVLYLIQDWVTNLIKFGDVLDKILMLIFIVLSIISVFLLYYQIFRLRKIHRASLFYILSYIFGIASIQGCVALFCNPGALFILLSMILPLSNFDLIKNTEIFRYILIVSITILSVVLYFNIKSLRKSGKIFLKVDKSKLVSK